jgi:histone-lysine N-methyltransferase SETMAR
MVEQLDISLVERQRCAIEFCVRLGKSGSETLQLVHQAYGDNAMRRAAVFKWWKRFRDGEMNVKDEPRSGRPSTAVTEANVEKAEELLKEDRRLSLRDLSFSLGVSMERTHRIVMDCLKMRRVCARWVPHDLTDEQRRKRVEICHRHKAQALADPQFLNSVITCDEFWIRHCDLKTKQQSLVWKHKDSPPPKKFRMNPSADKIMLILFFDAKGIILQHWVPPGQTVSGQYYATILRTDFINALRKKRPDFSGKKWFLLQDNARPHTAKVAMDALIEIGGTPLEHPPYSPDLAPCDFWAFPSMKRELRGKKFQSDQEVKTACSTILLKLAANGLQHVFEKWVECCKKCIACQGRYFEKETTTAPPQCSDSE